MKILVGKDYEEFAEIGAEYVADYIRKNPGKLLCLAAGDTPLGIYKNLIAKQTRGEVDLNLMCYVGLDEWVGIGYETQGSCAQVMEDNFYALAEIDRNRICVFDGLSSDLESECGKIERWINEHGGIALTLLGVGMNGHIGFNEPYCDTETDVAVVDLDEMTSEVGKKYFSGAACPTKGVTVGVKPLKSASEVILAVTGAKKGNILKKTLTEEPSNAVPATLLQNHPKLTVITDELAFKASCEN